MIGKLLYLSWACLSVSAAWAATATLTPANTHQTIEGFGGGVVYYQNWFVGQDAATKTALFDTAFTGLGISIMRVGNWLQNDSTDNGLDSDLEIYQALKARRPGAKVFMSSWSAPDSIKVNGSVNGNGRNDNSTNAALPKPQNTLEKDGGNQYKYAQFAQWWRQTYQRYVAKGITPNYVSIQNEPDMNAKYAATVFDPTENDSLAGYAQAFKAVRDTFTQAGITAKLYGPEPLGIGYNNFQNYAGAMTNLGQTPDGYAFHMYHNGVDNSSSAYGNPESFRTALSSLGTNYTSKPLIMSEYCHMDQSQPADYDMVGLAYIMQIGFSAGNLAGYVNWELLWGSDNAVNGQMISVGKPAAWGGTGAFTVNPEYHAMRHYSRFVNPGWKRIDAAITGDDDLKPVAFKSADGDSITLVVVNASTTTEAPLSGYGVTGYKISHMVQSVTGGAMSKVLTNATCAMLPPRSITTIVLVSGTETLPAATCGAGNTVVPAYSGVPSGIVLYNALTSGITGWSVSSAKISVVAASTATSQSVAKLSFSNEVQADHGYSNLNFDMSGVTEDLSTCQTLSLSVFNEAATVVSVNFSLDDAYAGTGSIPAGSGAWTTASFSLSGKGLGDKLSLNSDGFGPVYIANISALGCSSGPNSSIVIHDFTTGVLGTWTASETTAPSIISTALDGKSKYAYLPLAGCDQEVCGYKNVQFTNDVLGQAMLGKCQSLVINAHAEGASSSLNVGALGSAWIDYGYGYSVATADAWKDLVIPLTGEASNASTQLKFNSNSTGIYISKISATGCEGVSGALLHESTNSLLPFGQQVRIYNFMGKNVWQGVLAPHMLQGQVLRMSGWKQGVYLLKGSGASLRVIQK